ncbi:hypothetical protein ACH5RR_021158 [Cinchona calisaya]|uniref:Uncharacterized protein n=1 Tax=Cinchona calisaya TaxID=153742 RepID=A0ABD2ZHI8_9GENT
MIVKCNVKVSLLIHNFTKFFSEDRLSNLEEKIIILLVGKAGKTLTTVRLLSPGGGWGCVGLWCFNSNFFNLYETLSKIDPDRLGKGVCVTLRLMRLDHP